MKNFTFYKRPDFLGPPFCPLIIFNLYEKFKLPCTRVTPRVKLFVMTLAYDQSTADDNNVLSRSLIEHQYKKEGKYSSVNFC